MWLALVAAGEGLLGLKLHPLFTVPAAFAAMTLTPYLDARAMRKGVWTLCIAVSLGAALIATAIAGFQPAFSRTMAQRLSIRYVEDRAAKKTQWSLDAGAPLPPSLRKAADFAADPQPISPDRFRRPMPRRRAERRNSRRRRASSCPMRQVPKAGD